VIYIPVISLASPSDLFLVTVNAFTRLASLVNSDPGNGLDLQKVGEFYPVLFLFGWKPVVQKSKYSDEEISVGIFMKGSFGSWRYTKTVFKISNGTKGRQWGLLPP